MAGKKKVKKAVVAKKKKKVSKKKLSKGVQEFGRLSFEAMRPAPKPEPEYAYTVTSKYATQHIDSFSTLKAAQDCIEANAQINDLELLVVVTTTKHLSDTW